MESAALNVEKLQFSSAALATSAKNLLRTYTFL
jgi:hypothetical protein